MLSLTTASLSYHAAAPLAAATRGAAPQMEEAWTAEAAKFVIGGQTIEKPFSSGEIGDAEGLAALARSITPTLTSLNQNMSDCANSGGNHSGVLLLGKCLSDASAGGASGGGRLDDSGAT